MGNVFRQQSLMYTLGMSHVKVSSGILTWARESLGISLEDAVQKSRVAVSELKLIENGEKAVSLSQLKRFANLYKRPLATFFLPAVPVKELVSPDFRTLDSVESNTLSKEVRLAIRRANRNRKILKEISEELGEEVTKFSLVCSITDDPELVASRIRQELKVTLQQQREWGDKSRVLKHWIAQLEDLGVIVSQISLPVEEMRGFCLKGHGLAPAIVINKKDDEHGRIFTLWHEFAHLLVKDDKEIGHKKLEQFANHFAGAFLVPSNDFLSEPHLQRFLEAKSDYYLQRLAGLFSVSKEVILRRLLILNKISEEYYLEKRKEIARHNAELEKRRKAKEREKEKKGFSQPGRDAFQAVGHNLAKKVFDAQSRGKITQSDVAGVFEVKTKHFSKIKESLNRYDF